MSPRHGSYNRTTCSLAPHTFPTKGLFGNVFALIVPTLKLRGEMAKAHEPLLVFIP